MLYWLALRRGQTSVAGGVGPPAIASGLFALAIGGLIAGLPYGLIYAALAGLSAKIAQEIVTRTEPAYDIGTSSMGILGGAVLGAAVTAASFYAGVAHVWLPFVWGSATLVLVVAFGTSGRSAAQAVATSPALLLRRDRSRFWRSVVLVAVGAAAAVGIRASAGGQPSAIGLLAAAGTLITYGLTAGLTVAIAQTRYGGYVVRVSSLAAHGKLPWRLMCFLDDAYERRVLRRSGNVYRFRHTQLTEHLAVR